MKSTKAAILDTAERLFAARGVHNVSVRAILAEAGVNVALAHYYFGSRDGLIREVLRRRIEPLNDERLRRLDDIEATAGPPGPAIEAVLMAFLGPVVDLLDDRPEFARLVGQLHVASTARLRQVFHELFGVVLRRFSSAIKRSLPTDLTDPQVLGRGHFVLGAMILTLTNYADLTLMAKGRYEVPKGETLLQELVTFCAAGLTAPATGRATTTSPR